MSPMIQRPFWLEFALLGYLSHTPQHGYSLHQQLSARDGLGMVWRLKPSQLYAILEKLEAAGLVTSQLQSQDPHPPRRMFSLTKAGRNEFEAWRVGAVERPHQMRQLFFAKLYFCLQESPQLAQKLIEDQKQTTRMWLAELEERARNLNPSASFEGILLQYRRHQVNMILSWLDSCLVEPGSELKAA